MRPAETLRIKLLLVKDEGGISFVALKMRIVILENIISNCLYVNILTSISSEGHVPCGNLQNQIQKFSGGLTLITSGKTESSSL